MARSVGQSIGFFREQGRRGGLKRARRLSAEARSSIASRAAHVRWGTQPLSKPLKPSVRLGAPRWQDPVYLEEILEEGSLHDWSALYHRIADHPFGDIAQALERCLAAARIYGVTPLWRGILHSLRGGLS